MLVLEPVTLTGKVVRLEPMKVEHAEGLLPHAREPEIWRYMPYGDINSLERVRWLINELLGRAATGRDLPFTTFDIATNQPIGLTRYMDAMLKDDGLEIGGTWLGMAFRRTAANTEAKYLLLRHAFEALHCVRVQIKTDLRNERSQRAIERIGAVKEGVLRKQIKMPDGYMRSSVYYSILDDEWPAVKQRLEDMLAAHGARL